MHHISDVIYFTELREPIELNFAAGIIVECCWSLHQTVGRVFWLVRWCGDILREDYANEYTLFGRRSSNMCTNNTIFNDVIAAG